MHAASRHGTSSLKSFPKDGEVRHVKVRICEGVMRDGTMRIAPSQMLQSTFLARRRRILSGLYAIKSASPPRLAGGTIKSN